MRFFTNFINYSLLFFNKLKKQKKEINNTDEFTRKAKKRNYWPLSRIAGRIVIWYSIAIIIGTILLAAPISLNDDGKGLNGGHDYQWDFLSSLFTSTSAFSDTGLTVINVAKNYTFFGQFVMLFLIEIGGFGVLTFKVMFYIFIGKKITLKDKLLVQGERGSSFLGGTIELIKSGFLFLIVVEIISAVALFIPFYFYEVPTSNESLLDINAYHNYSMALWSAIFHSVSAINNAGFDIIGNSSLAPYDKMYVIQVIFILEFVAGGIGFPTFYDISKKVKSKYNKEYSRLTLFTKLNLITYFVISIIGVSSVLIIEIVHRKEENSIFSNSSGNFNFFMNIFFNTMSTRNAGFSTIDMGNFETSSKLIMSAMMFIGSAPSSTAGGIRTTTLSVICISVISIMRNDNSTAFKRKIPAETVKKSFSVFAISIFLIFMSCVIVLAQYDTIPMVNILFILSSAFGTTGLSTLSIDEMLSLSIIPKIVMILLMLIGQIGISNSLLMFKTKNKKEYKLIEEEITIG